MKIRKSHRSHLYTSNIVSEVNYCVINFQEAVFILHTFLAIADFHFENGHHVETTSIK